MTPPRETFILLSPILGNETPSHAVWFRYRPNIFHSERLVDSEEAENDKADKRTKEKKAKRNNLDMKKVRN